MRRITRSTERGQALVLVAFALVILIGFIGLAVDGGRLFWERRTLQNAVDAAALAASDNYQDSQSLSASLQAAAREYAANERIYTSASASPSWTSATSDVTWPGVQDRMHVVFSTSGLLAMFDVSSAHRVGLAFMVALGAGANASVSALAQGRAKTGGTWGSGLVTLSTGNCSGGNPSLTISGGATISVDPGNVQVNGSLNYLGSGTLTTSGTFSNNCTGSIPGAIRAAGGAFTGQAPVTDPGFAPGPLATYNLPQSAGTNVVLNPGIYSGDPGTAAGPCYFLSPGIYQFSGGINDSSNNFSNELRPPDEPAWNGTAPNYDNSVANPQFWSGCSGSFSLTTTTSANALTIGNWGVMLTSTRTDYYPPQAQGGTAYKRESSPSTCHSLTVNTPAKALTLNIHNVPGAQGYNVYLSFVTTGDPCASGPWLYITNIPNPIVETTTSLGIVSANIDAQIDPTLPTTFNAGALCGVPLVVFCTAATGPYGSPNPPGDGAETAPLSAGNPPFIPARDVPANGGGDRANAHYCQPAGTPASPCGSATVTPGAVQLYFPGSACLNLINNSTMRIFSGIQYAWISVFGPSSNTCTSQVGDSSTLESVGTYYWPRGTLQTNGNPGYLVYFTQLIVNTYNSNGNENVIIQYDTNATPAQGFSQISQ